MSRPDVDPYEILGLEPGASWDEIRTAYRRLAKKHHPDKNLGDRASEWIFKDVNRAYEQLRDVGRVQDDMETPEPSRSSREGGFDRPHREPQPRACTPREQASKDDYLRSEQRRTERSAAWQNLKESGKPWAILAVLLLFAYVVDPKTDPFGLYPDSVEFTIGSHPDDVLRIQGTPSRIEYLAPGYQVWHYGGNTVTISPSPHVPSRGGLVTGWSNSDGQLKVRLTPGLGSGRRAGRGEGNLTDPEFFSQGSHHDDVLRIQGTPTQIQPCGRPTTCPARLDPASRYDVWHYGSSRVTISIGSRRVTEWSNSDGQLMVRLISGANTTGSELFTRGSHADDVVRLQGTPTKIQVWSTLGYEDWHYGRNTVTISTAKRRVTEWSNPTGELKVRIVPGAKTDGSNESSATLGRAS